MPSCTFGLSGPSALFQAIWVCHTCNAESGAEGRCCCSGCAAACHEGHDVEWIAEGPAYCDCGAAGCCNVPPDAVPLAGGGEHTSVLDTFAGQGVAHDMAWSEDAPLLALVKEQAQRLVGKSKETFWLGEGDEPRCALEGLARRIYLYHVGSLGEGPAAGGAGGAEGAGERGAEWWVQVKDVRGPEAWHGAIDLHYDKDEHIAEEYVVGVFPQVSTVTYLTDAAEAGPTIVVENALSNPPGTPISRAIVAHPAVGRHLAFDGKFLHGAPREALLRRPSEGKDALRITFLVNCWLGHRPRAVERLPAEVLATLFDDASAAGADAADALPISPGTLEAPTPVDEETPGSWAALPFLTQDASWGVDEDGGCLVLSIFVPDAVRVGGGVQQLHYREESMAACLEDPEGEEEAEEGEEEADDEADDQDKEEAGAGVEP